jgi:serine/threonine protein kinase
VAIKQIEKQQIQQVGKTRSVFREKDLLFELDHPFIIKLLGVAQDETLLYFIFENCENGDFADMIAKRNKLSIEVTRIYAAQIVQVLAYLQSKEVMHRDLKPQNMLLDQNMNIKIVRLC